MFEIRRVEVSLLVYRWEFRARQIMIEAESGIVSAGEWSAWTEVPIVQE